MDEFDHLQTVGYLIAWAQRLSARLAEQELKSLEIAPAYLPVLFALHGGGSMSPGVLAKAAAIEPATMTLTLTRMERDGFIERRPNKTDGRSKLVSLTPHAAGKLAEAARIIKRVNRETLSVLGKEDRAVFLKSLRLVIAQLNEMTAK